MMQRIRNAYMQDISRLDWMDASTKRRALEKLSALDFQIGYEEAWKELDRLPPLELSPSKYLDNTMKILVRRSQLERAKLTELVDRSHWSRPAAVVNAFYSSERNVLYIPAGILQPPFFFTGGGLARNYGGVGSILGHELSHALDDSGSRFDKDGRLDQWWDEHTLASFEAKTRCVADQFSSFSDAEGGRINGNLTLGEAIADGGVSRPGGSSTWVWNGPRPRAPNPVLGVPCSSRAAMVAAAGGCMRASGAVPCAWPRSAPPSLAIWAWWEAFVEWGA